MEDRTRRRFLATSASVFGVAVAGCMTSPDDDEDPSVLPGGDDDDETNETDGTSDTDTDGDGDGDDEDPEPQYTGTEPVITDAAPQRGVDWRNTSWLAGTPIREKPTEEWTYSVGDRTMIVGGGVSGDNRVYYITGSGSIVSVAADDGEELMNAPLGVFNESVLAYDDDRVFAGGYIGTEQYDGFLTQMDPDDGEEQWGRHYESGTGGGTTAYEGTVYQGTATGTLYAYDAEEGEELWSSSVGGSAPVVGEPAVTDESVYFCTESHVRCCDAETGDTVWDAEIPRTVTGRPVVYGDVLVVQAAPFIAVFEAATGDEVWGESVGADYTGVAVADDTVILPMDGSESEVKAVDVFTGDDVFELSLGAPPTASPVVVDDVAYIPAVGGLAGVDTTTGELLWRYGTPESVTASPVVINGVVVVQTESRVHAVTA